MTTNNKYLPSEYNAEKSKTKYSRVIAVGASAGGLEALKSFFEHIPESDNNSYIVIQHLSPDYKSMMAELLQKHTRLPIVEIEDGMQIVSGHIYLIPPANNLVLKDDKLHLVNKPKTQTLNLPIDMFFESLAREKKGDAIGIILSGTGSDGTRGVRAIKEHDGMVMVQSPEQSKFDGMPQSAISTGMVDYVLDTNEMGEELKNFILAPSVFHFKDGDIAYDKSELMKILSYVDQKTGLDFREYKHSTLARRVARRVNVCKCKSLSDYYSFMQSKDGEVEILYREFLIGVTKFFRDPQVWEVLIERIFPNLVAKKKDGEVIKIWDVGCSTGEEAYSLAMCLLEEIEKQGKNLELKIFATDIAEKHLEIGGKGCYPESIVADISEDLLLKYFLSKPDGYHVTEKLRNSIIFSKHNIIKNPPFSNMDLVACRNLLIYFQPNIQRKAISVLHYALKEEGVLFLGTSESVSSHQDNFIELDRKWKIFQNINPSTRLKTEISHGSSRSLVEDRSYKNKKSSLPRANPVRDKLQNELTETILEQFGGASVFVDSEFNILQAVGEFRKYANLPITGFSINLLDMMGQDLKYIIQSTFKKAKSKNAKVHYNDAHFIHEGETKGVDIVVKPYKNLSKVDEATFVITFIEKEVNLADVETIDKITITNRTKEYVSNLEEDLRQTKEDLQTSLEEIETSNEELQAANEELLASNEELQSTNEELQSVNEEINTVNAENLQKMDDLSALNADMENLLKSTQIGTIFLDGDLKIRKFTPTIKEHFSFINTDIGRPISHFTTNIGKSNLLNRVSKVLSTGVTLEKPIVSDKGEYYLRRISPYINTKGAIDGVVITFIDIQSLQRSKQKLILSERRFKSLYEKDPILHVSVDPNSSLITACNEMAVQVLEYQSKEELLGSSIFDLYDEETQIKALKSNKVFQETGYLVNMEQSILTHSGKKIPVILNATAEKDENDQIQSIRYTFVDISSRKEAEDKLVEQKKALEQVNKDLEQFVSICSHDLQEPLATIKFGSDVLGKLYKDKLDQKGQDYIEYIKDASTRLAEQIRALLEHSKIGRSGEMKLVDTKEVVEIVKYDLGKRIKDSKANVYIGTLPKIMGYEVELRLLFQNLISNAIKYTAKDRDPEVRISAYKEDDSWVFSILDNGIGISQEDLKNIFTIFSRVPGTETKEGTGVGLAHVEKIVQLHGGTIWVDSQKGVGSTFYFKLKA